jgi:sn-glycerol 3-phosphate transport system substrate-binding protein
MVRRVLSVETEMRLSRREVLATAAAGVTALAAPHVRAEARVPIVFWHAMSGSLGDEVNRIAKSFNAAQNEYELTAIYKGGYIDVLPAAIAAWRAGQPPHILQCYEVGTGTMIAAGPAIKPAWQLFSETGVPFDPHTYIPAVRGYYSYSDGLMASMPFNSSTCLMWLNADAFRRTGLDPDQPPATWDQVIEAARRIQAAKAVEYAMTSASFSWAHFEQFGAIHNIPYATKANGFDGWDAELRTNTAPRVKMLARLVDSHKQGMFAFNGLDSAGDPVFPAGRAAMTFDSSASRGRFKHDLKFAFAGAFLPYDQTVIASPINSVIGGASLWTMTQKDRSRAEYEGVARFFHFIAQPEQDMLWHQNTGYVPVTLAGYELARQQGYYEKEPGADLPIKQLLRHEPTENSRGFRLGRMPEVRNILEQQVERAMQGQVDPQGALDTAVDRGNTVLREFQRSLRT